MVSSEASVTAWEGARRQEPGELMGPPLQTRLTGSEDGDGGAEHVKCKMSGMETPRIGNRLRKAKEESG